MDWRYALTKDDLKFVVSCWFNHQLRPFVRGPGCPFKGLSATVNEARKRGNTKLLHKIYHAEMHRLIEGSLQSNPTLVVYDLDQPYFIVGWANRDFAFVREVFRGKGIYKALRAAIEQG